MKQEKQIQLTDKVLLVRGGAIGLVSGAKGGGAAGALGGALTMFLSMSDNPTAIVLFTIIVGLTLGGMAGAFLGALQGMPAGALSSYLWQRQRSFGWLWFLFAVVLGAVTGWLLGREYGLMAVLVGGLCGLLWGWISQRDFEHMWELQHSDPAEA